MVEYKEDYRLRKCDLALEDTFRSRYLVIAVVWEMLRGIQWQTGHFRKDNAWPRLATAVAASSQK